VITITLPDGSQRQFSAPLSVYELAQSIGAGLAKATVAGKVDGVVVDASYLLDRNLTVSIVTLKDPEGVEVLRHSCAHLMAHAVKRLFPSAQVTIGPVIEDGFFYDFSFKERSFTPEDLLIIEKTMQDIAKENLTIERTVIAREEAIQYFKSINEHYKAEIITDLPATETLTLYKQGDFTDLCRGPHLPNTSFLKEFKLMKLAGAYWRGDSKNEMLQRIYGTVWPDAKQLKDYLFRLEEAEKRDHRKIAKQLDLFHMQEEAPGMIFWHPNGWTLYQILEQYMRAQFKKHGYQEVRTPQIVDRVLWERSGHWDKFGEDMFYLKTDERHYAIKPMNCPCHVQIFNQGVRSYRELPVRLAEFGCCHRNEASGALHGLLRTRSFIQDDAHIFCTEEQIGSEAQAFIKMLFEVYGDFGLGEQISVKLSTRPEKRVGADEVWDKAESVLTEVLNQSGLNWQLLPGEGAFYGPKIEFVLEDCIGRKWTTGSVQLDFSMPTRLGAEYTSEEGEKRTPVMLHRAILGSIERFLGILIEQHAGKFPTWLSPIQVCVLNITDRQAEYSREIAKTLVESGVRCKTDLRNEKIGYKIREHTLQRVPYLLIIGDKELESRSVSVRMRDGQDLGSMTIDEFLKKIHQDVEATGGSSIKLAGD
jgi:threonyl-tRNA synthetase